MIGRIPFSLPDEGLDEIEGFVWIDDGCLVIDLESKFLGLIKRDRKTIKVVPTALHDVTLATGLIRDKLRILPKRLDLLEAMPGKNPREVVLRVNRKHRPWAEDLVDELREWIEEAEEEDWDD